MTTTINASTSSGLVNTADTSGVLQLQTANTTAVTIDASQNVGVGTTSPAYKLDVSGQVRANAGSAASALIANSTNAGGTALNVQNSGTVNMLVGGYNSIVGSGNATDVMLSATQGVLAFGTGASSTERMRIDSSGNVGIGASTPLNRLHVSQSLAGSASSSAGIARISNTRLNTGDGASTLLFVTDEVDGNTQDKRGQIGGEYDGSSGGRLVFSTAQTTTKTMTERMRIDSSGNVLIGTTGIPNGTSIYGSAFQVASNNRVVLEMGQSTTSNNSLLYFFNPNGQVGTISTSGSATSYNTSSDYRLKEDVTPMTGALNKVAQLNPVTYKWKADGVAGQGFIAHELAEVVPECVSGEKDAVDENGKPEYQGVDTSFLVATLTAAIQEQQALITDLTTRLAALEGAK